MTDFPESIKQFVRIGCLHAVINKQMQSEYQQNVGDDQAFFDFYARLTEPDRRGRSRINVGRYAEFIGQIVTIAKDNGHTVLKFNVDQPIDDTPDDDGHVLERVVSNLMLTEYRTDYAIKEVLKLVRRNAETPAAGKKKITLKRVSEYEEREAEWLIHNFIPKGQITVFAGDGGAGKTYAIANLLAAVSSGNRSIFEDQIPFDAERKTPQNVMFFSGEDTIPETLKKRLRVAGADMDRIFTLSLEDDGFELLKFGESIIEELVAEYRPALVVFDPLESFLSDGVQMNSRNTMRILMQPLTRIGATYGTSFIIVMHTNKLRGVWARQRIADSADMWDISRSVFLFGRTREGAFYCSHEKSNYCDLQQTVTYKIEGADDGAKAVFLAVSSLKDRDYVLEAAAATRSNHVSSKDDVAKYIMEVLEANNGEPMYMKDLEDSCDACGFSKNSFKDAKADLKSKGKVIVYSEGFGTDKKFKIKLK